ncbi:MAG: glycosyltransferase 87 family protein [Thermoleophilia bacterium]
MLSLIKKTEKQTAGAPAGGAPFAAIRNAGLLSLLVYALFCLLALFIPGSDRSFFPPYVALPVSVEDTSGLLLVGTLVLGAALSLFALYFYTLARTRRVECLPGVTGARETADAAGIARLAFFFAVAFHLVMVAFPTLLSTDLFDYVRHGRIFVFHGENPLTVPAIFFQHDPFFNLGGWVSTGSVYGPLHVYVSGGLALISGDRVGAAFIIFKSFYLAVNVVNLLLIWKIAARLNPGSQARAIIFFGWNPFIVILAAANGHNDILMLAFVLAAVLCYLDRRLMLGVLCLTLATLVKFVTLPLLVLYVALMLREPARLHRKAMTALAAGGIAVLTTVASYIPFWEGGGTFDYLTRVGSKTGFTIASLFSGFVRGALGMPRGATIIILALPLAAYVAWKMLKVRDIRQYIYASAVVAAFFPLVMFWFQPWYIVLALGLVALNPKGPLFAMMLTFSVSAIFFDNFWWQSPIRMDVQKFLRVAVVFGPPLAVYAYLRLRDEAPVAWNRLITWSLEEPGAGSGGEATSAQLAPGRMALEAAALVVAAAVPLAVVVASSSQLRSLVDLMLVKLRLLIPF